MTESNPNMGSPSPVDYATAQPGGYTGPAPTKEETNMAMLIYILGIFTGFIGPLILWLVKKNESAFINDQGKEVLNFQITAFLAYVVCIILMFVIIGLFLFPVVVVCYLVFLIIGATKANKGIAYRFPFALRLLK